MFTPQQEEAMAVTPVSTANEPRGPLDILEKLLVDECNLERVQEDMLWIGFSGQWGEYELYVTSHQPENEVGMLRFHVILPAVVPETSHRKLFELLALVNANITLGHFSFDAQPERQRPEFVYVLLLANNTSTPTLLDMAVQRAFFESERCYPAFMHVIWGGKSPQEAFEHACINTEGEA